MTKQIMFDRIGDCNPPGLVWDSGKLTPANSRAFYVLKNKTILMISATGRFYSSTSFGTSWTAGPIISNNSFFRALASYDADETILLAPCEAGNILYISYDQGKTWQSSGQVTSIGYINEICVLADGSILVTSVTFSAGPADTLVYRSTDLGKSWVQIAAMSMGGNYPKMIQLDNGHLLLTSRSYPGFKLSQDFGTTWADLSETGSRTAGFFGLCQDRSTGNLYASESSGSNRIFVSADRGQHWRELAKISGASDIGPLFMGEPGCLYCYSAAGTKLYRSRYSEIFPTVYPTFRNNHICNDLTSGKIFDALTGNLLDIIPNPYVPTKPPYLVYNIKPGESWYRPASTQGYGLKNSKNGRFYNFKNDGDNSDYLRWADDTGFYLTRYFFGTVPTRTDLIKVFYDDFSEITLYSMSGTFLNDYWSDNNGTFLAIQKDKDPVPFSVKNNTVVYNTYLIDNYYNVATSSHILSSWDDGQWGYSMNVSRGASFDAMSGILSESGLFATPTKILSRIGEFFDIVTPRYSQFGTPREQLTLVGGQILESGIPVLFIYDPNATSGYYSIYAPKNRFGGFGYMLELFLNSEQQNNLINFHRPVSTVLGKFKT